MLVDGQSFPLSKLRKRWEDGFESANRAEAQQGGVRLGMHTEILQFTPKSADKIAVQYRMTRRITATQTGWQQVTVSEGRDLWLRKNDRWKIHETAMQRSETKTFQNGQEI